MIPIEEDKPKCEHCDKEIDFEKELEGRDWGADEDGEFHHLKCQLKQGFNVYCPNCKTYWIDGYEEEDADGNTTYVCPECKGELEDSKPTLKDFQFEPRYCKKCGHTDGVHSKYSVIAVGKSEYLCWQCGCNSWLAGELKSETSAQAPLGAKATEYPPSLDKSQLPCRERPADGSAKA